MRKRNAGIAAQTSYGFPCVLIGVIAGLSLILSDLIIAGVRPGQRAVVSELCLD